MFGIWPRILFAINHKTLKRISSSREDSDCLAIYHKGRVVRIHKRCPHQGGPLEKGYIQGDDIVCPWHGCHFSLKTSGEAQPYVPILKSP